MSVLTRNEVGSACYSNTPVSVATYTDTCNSVDGDNDDGHGQEHNTNITHQCIIFLYLN